MRKESKVSYSPEYTISSSFELVSDSINKESEKDFWEVRNELRFISTSLSFKRKW